MTAASASAPALERRRERRIAIRLTMVVSGTDRTGYQFEERVKSENLCRGGLAFASRYPLDLGDQLEIQIPVPPTTNSEEKEFATQGRVVHLAEGRRPEETLVGVEFTGPRFTRLFVSEATE